MPNPGSHAKPWPQDDLPSFNGQDSRPGCFLGISVFQESRDFFVTALWSGFRQPVVTRAA